MSLIFLSGNMDLKELRDSLHVTFNLSITGIAKDLSCLLKIFTPSNILFRLLQRSTELTPKSDGPEMQNIKSL